MKITGVIATTNPDQDGEILTPEALSQLAQTAVGKGLSAECKHEIPNWFVTKSELHNQERGDDFVTVEMEGNPLVGADLEKLYAVPAYKTDGKGGYRLTSIGLTKNPADDHLTPIEIIGEDS